MRGRLCRSTRECAPTGYYTEVTSLSVAGLLADSPRDRYLLELYPIGTRVDSSVQWMQLHNP